MYMYHVYSCRVLWLVFSGFYFLWSWHIAQNKPQHCCQKDVILVLHALCPSNNLTVGFSRIYGTFEDGRLSVSLFQQCRRDTRWITVTHGGTGRSSVTEKFCHPFLTILQSQSAQVVGHSVSPMINKGTFVIHNVNIKYNCSYCWPLNIRWQELLLNSL